METIKKAVRSTKKVVYEHRIAIAVAITAALCLKVNQIALSQHNDFLREHDLYEEFYTPTDEELSA